MINFKQINFLTDTVMPSVSPNAFKVIMLVARKTLGFGKGEDVISISQFMKLCGISNKTTCLKYVDDAVKSGWVMRDKRYNSYVYMLHPDILALSASTNSVPASTNSVPPKQTGGTNSVPKRYNSYTPTSINSVPPLVQNLYQNGTEFVPTNSITNNNIRKEDPPRPTDQITFSLPRPKIPTDKFQLAKAIEAMGANLAGDLAEAWKADKRLQYAIRNCGYDLQTYPSSKEEWVRKAFFKAYHGVK